VIADNVISGSYDNSSNHTDGNGIIVDGNRSIPPALIANNLTYENGGRGIEVANNRGDVWVVNNTGYADGLDLQIGDGQAPEFAAIHASDVHFVNDLAFGRRRSAGFRTAYVYNNTASVTRWAHDLGFDGVTTGVSPAVTHNRAAYWYVNPLLVNPPRVPHSRTPWASAVPPWRVGHDFVPRRRSPTLGAGANPATVPGATRALAAGLERYVRTRARGGHRGRRRIDIGAYI
jgi:hypothetical protein